MSTEKKLDIFDLIAEIKDITTAGGLVRSNDKRYYGRVSFCFENGKLTHIEKVETMK